MIQDRKNDFQVELKATMERIAIQQCKIVLTLVNRSYVPLYDGFLSYMQN